MQNLDVTVAAQFLRELSKDAALEIANAFTDDVTKLTQTMAEASKVHDVVTFREAALNLAGVAATFGALYLEALARQAMNFITVPSLQVMACIERAASYAVYEIGRFAGVGVDP
jgi:hypothetical protein